MKKIYLLFVLFVSTNLFAGQVVTVSKLVSDLATQYGWKHDSTYLSFQLDDAIAITSTQGNAKYCSDNAGKSLRYYQDCRKGEFAIVARAGVTIQSIKLTYIQQKANSVVCTNWGTDGKKIGAAYQVKSGESFPVNADQIALYVGRTDDNTSGQVRITAIEVTFITAGGNQVLSVTTQALADKNGWGDLTALRHFDLNEVLSVDVDSAGTMKYTMNTKQCHCYQWLGGFTIQAKAGCTIKTVKLTYFSVKTGMMTMNWGVDGKNIPEEDRIASNAVVVVNGSSVKFYVGATTDSINGQIRISAWEVEYTQPKTSDVMMRTTLDLGKQYGWADGTCPGEILFNNALSFHSDKSDNVKYYSTTKSFHCYQWSGGFYLKSRPGTLIKSVALSYDALNNAVLTQNWGADGKNIPEDDWIASGAIVPVNGDSVHFYTGDKSNTSNCQLHITGFSVVYVDSLAMVETFASCELTESGTTLSVTGDKGIYNWQLKNFQRTSADVVYTNQGTRLLYEGVIASDGELEGGVKDVSFDWRTSSDSCPIHFTVKAGSWSDEFQRDGYGRSNYVINYTKEVALKQNSDFSISVGAQEPTAQLQPVIGSITITPYLLFKVPNHRDSMDTNVTEYDLKPLLINNSGELPTYEVVENTTGDEVAIVNGVVDLSQIESAGMVRVKASCFGGDVYTTLTLFVSIAPRVYFEEMNKVVHLGDEPFVNPLIVPDSVGTITYSSSNTNVAMVNDTGLVTIMGLGQAVISANVAASGLYIATKATFNLSVIYTPAEGTYRVETFSQCRKKKVTEGFTYVEGDDAVYDWNLSNYSRDKKDTIKGEQGITINYGGAIASNGVQEGGVKYLSFNWRVTDPILPVHFFVNMDNTSMSYSSAAVGDPDMVMTYSQVCAMKSNTILSISVRAKENPAQSPIVVGPLQIVPYLLFTNKYLELQLLQTSYDCAEDLINNTDSVGEVVYSIVSSTCDTVAMEGSVLDLSATTTAGDVQLQATWGEVNTTMTVHVTIPSGLNENVNENVNRKVVKDGEMWIWREGAWYTVLGCPRKP